MMFARTSLLALTIPLFSPSSCSQAFRSASLKTPVYATLTRLFKCATQLRLASSSSSSPSPSPSSSSPSSSSPSQKLRQEFHSFVDLFCYDDAPIGSTQDEAKRLLAGGNNNKQLAAVLAREQTNGRGTKGRSWEGTAGNLHLTLALPTSKIPVTLTLLPLQVGVLICNILEPRIPVPGKIVVKWPNDVLIDDRKVAGVLIENYCQPYRSSSDSWLLIGIGINVAFAPILPGNARPATSLQALYDLTLPESTAYTLGIDLIHAVLAWVSLEKSQVELDKRVLEEWKSWAKFNQIYSIRDTGEEVTTLGIQPDGQLKVRGSNGQIRFLLADYLH